MPVGFKLECDLPIHVSPVTSRKFQCNQPAHSTVRDKQVKVMDEWAFCNSTTAALDDETLLCRADVGFFFPLKFALCVAFTFIIETCCRDYTNL